MIRRIEYKKDILNNRLLPNYAMNERFSTTKKLYHELQQIVKRFLEMQLIVAFKEPTRLMLLVIPQSPRRILLR